MPTDVVGLWWLTLALALVVILVVAVLLIAIVVAANRIDKHVEAIWGAGKEIATNTVQIWQLQKTNATAGQILGVAQSIAAGAASIDGRLERLPAALAGHSAPREDGR
jgi:ABC-type bacteriocin/lantibiotic exporter with double-glycine peptidase domain